MYLKKDTEDSTLYYSKKGEKDGTVILSKLHRERLTDVNAESECCRKREKDYELKKNKCDDLI